MNYSTKTLELNKILAVVSNYAISQTVKEIIINETPKNNFNFILDSLTETNEVLKIFNTYNQFPFDSNYEITKIIDTLKVINYLTIPDFLKLRNFIIMTNKFKSYQSELSDEFIIIKSYLSQITPLNNSLTLINQVFDSNHDINNNASKNLNEIRRKLNHKQNDLDKNLNIVLKRYQPYLNEVLIVMRENRYTLPVKDTYKRKVKGVVHDLSQSGQTIYIEPDELRQITQDIEILKREEQNEIIKILITLTKELKPYTDDFKNQINILIHLDYLSAKALYAKNTKSSLPKLNNDGIINLIKARHPLIDPKIVVPIDVTLNNEFNILMITGPNTGGKTVALKTVGLLTLMLQTGLLIPAKEDSEMAVFNQVLADIGDEQSIIQSLSTFSSHISKIKQMVDNLKENSLILLDELGSGTDPIEGVSLAMAIINYLKEFKGIRLILTTHYSELKMFAYSKPNILTASVSFDLESLKPLYKLKLGIAGSSNALLIAEKLGLNPNIIYNAKEILKGNQTSFSVSLEKLTNEQNKLELLKDELKLKENDLNEKIKLYEEELTYLEKERQRILTDVKKSEEAKYEKIKKEALNLIEELSSKKTLTTPEYAKYKGELNKSNEPSKKSQNKKLNVGDYVLVLTYNQEGIITKIKNKEYYVSFGQFELPFKNKDLVKTNKPLKEKSLRPTKNISTTPKREASFELDLRGVRYIEVKDLLDKAIDNALLSNLSTIRVIHGFGTGAIRKAVYEYINNSTAIKSHRYGGEGEGLNGVTIISL